MLMKNYFKFRCVYCGQNMECEPRHSGRQTKCPKCDHKMVIPPAPDQSTGKSPNTVNATWDTQVPAPDVSIPTRYQ